MWTTKSGPRHCTIRQCIACKKNQIFYPDGEDIDDELHQPCLPTHTVFKKDQDEPMPKKHIDDSCQGDHLMIAPGKGGAKDNGVYIDGGRNINARDEGIYIAPWQVARSEKGPTLPQKTSVSTTADKEEFARCRRCQDDAELCESCLFFRNIFRAAGLDV
jgi:hypothetical protein